MRKWLYPSKALTTPCYAKSDFMLYGLIGNGEVAFAEVPLPAINPVLPGENGFRPDITTGSVLIGVSNTASDALLGKRFEVIGHAR